MEKKSSKILKLIPEQYREEFIAAAQREAELDRQDMRECTISRNGKILAIVNGRKNARSWAHSYCQLNNCALNDVKITTEA